MYNGASRWGQAFNHWGLAVFFTEYTWLFKGVTFVFLLSFPLSLPFDWTLRCWVCVCCFVLFYFGYYVVLFVKKNENKKLLITKRKVNLWEWTGCEHHWNCLVIIIYLLFAFIWQNSWGQDANREKRRIGKGYIYIHTYSMDSWQGQDDDSTCKPMMVTLMMYNPKSEKVGTVWKTQIKKESSDF